MKGRIYKTLQTWGLFVKKFFDTFFFQSFPKVVRIVNLSAASWISLDKLKFSPLWKFQIEQLMVIQRIYHKFSYINFPSLPNTLYFTFYSFFLIYKKSFKSTNLQQSPGLAIFYKWRYVMVMSLIFSKWIFLFFAALCSVHGILAPRSGIKPRPPCTGSMES